MRARVAHVFLLFQEQLELSKGKPIRQHEFSNALEIFKWEGW